MRLPWRCERALALGIGMQDALSLTCCCRTSFPLHTFLCDWVICGTRFVGLVLEFHYLTLVQWEEEQALDPITPQ